MKKKTIFNIITALTLSANLLSTTSGLVHAETKVDRADSLSVQKKNKQTLTWTYPFAKLNKKGVHPMYNAQTFGKTDYARSLKPLSYFHDGWDFGWSEVGHSTVKAIHPGTVKSVAYGNGLGWFVWVVSPDNYVEIYQEGFKKKKDISVKPGQTIKTGQKIGKLTGTHLHLGLTKTNHNYINANGFPSNNWLFNNGTWLNPVKVIQKNIKK